MRRHSTHQAGRRRQPALRLHNAPAHRVTQTPQIAAIPGPREGGVGAPRRLIGLRGADYGARHDRPARLSACLPVGRPACRNGNNHRGKSKMMRNCRTWRRCVAAPLVALMAALSAPSGVAHAGLVGTEQLVEQRAGTARERVAGFLARDDVRAEMEALGIAPAEAEARVAALSDDELAAVAERIDTLPAGQSAVGAIVGAALIVFIILLITDLAGLTDVFGFTKKGALKAN
jgi:hypothetical protein